MAALVFPSLFVSHSGPSILDQDGTGAAFLRDLGQQLGRPRAILWVTAHASTPRLFYRAPGAVGLAADVVAALRKAGLPHAVDHQRGRDEAIWQPLTAMYPDANVPIAQLSVQPGADAAHHIGLGRALAALRRGGILIMGSGPSADKPGFAASLAEAACRGAVDEIVTRPNGQNLVPLLVVIGAAGGNRGRILGGRDGVTALTFDEAADGIADPQMHRHSRLRRDERERMIVEEAIRFFVDAGVDGQTRVLAERLGITQPLLYRYFPDKATLLARVFDELFARRWQPQWETTLRDRTRPLEERVRSFASGYCRTLCEDGWVRLMVSAGLNAVPFDHRLLDAVRRHVVLPLAGELRHDSGMTGEPGLCEIELAWGLHASLLFVAMRKWLHGMAVPSDLALLTDTLATSFVAGARAALGGHTRMLAE